MPKLLAHISSSDVLSWLELSLTSILNKSSQFKGFLFLLFLYFQTLKLEEYLRQYFTTRFFFFHFSL